MLKPVYRNIRHEIYYGNYKLGETYVTRWGWFLRTDYKTVNGKRRRFTSKEAAAETVIQEARKM